MDFTPIFDTLFNQFLYLIPLIIILAIAKSPWFKGVFGEFQVNLLINRFLPKDKYHLIKNVTLKTETGTGTTQIDHILVSKYGVFVIETKNMKGWIFGSQNQKQWTQKIFKHNSKFQNPLHQNYKHIKTLEDHLNITIDVIHSVIIFVGTSTFKTTLPENVTAKGDCIEHIRSKQDKVLSQSQVDETIRTIENGRLARGMKTNKRHTAHVKEIIHNKENEHNCRKCGSSMVLRVSKKDNNAGNKFWGCSTFPKCRSVVNIT
jgi:ribosomal protein L37AE/L43A